MHRMDVTVTLGDRLSKNEETAGPLRPSRPRRTTPIPRLSAMAPADAMALRRAFSSPVDPYEACRTKVDRLQDFQREQMALSQSLRAALRVAASTTLLPTSGGGRWSAKSPREGSGSGNEVPRCDGAANEGEKGASASCSTVLPVVSIAHRLRIVQRETAEFVKTQLSPSLTALLSTFEAYWEWKSAHADDESVISATGEGEHARSRVADVDASDRNVDEGSGPRLLWSHHHPHEQQHISKLRQRYDHALRVRDELLSFLELHAEAVLCLDAHLAQELYRDSSKVRLTEQDSLTQLQHGARGEPGAVLSRTPPDMKLQAPSPCTELESYVVQLIEVTQTSTHVTRLLQNALQELCRPSSKAVAGASTLSRATRAGHAFSREEKKKYEGPVALRSTVEGFSFPSHEKQGRDAVLKTTPTSSASSQAACRSAQFSEHASRCASTRAGPLKVCPGGSGYVGGSKSVWMDGVSPLTPASSPLPGRTHATSSVPSVSPSSVELSRCSPEMHPNRSRGTPTTSSPSSAASTVSLSPLTAPRDGRSAHRRPSEGQVTALDELSPMETVDTVASSSPAPPSLNSEAGHGRNARRPSAPTLSSDFTTAAVSPTALVSQGGRVGVDRTPASDSPYRGVRSLLGELVSAGHGADVIKSSRLLHSRSSPTNSFPMDGRATALRPPWDVQGQGNPDIDSPVVVRIPMSPSRSTAKAKELSSETQCESRQTTTASPTDTTMREHREASLSPSPTKGCATYAEDMDATSGGVTVSPSHSRSRRSTTLQSSSLPSPPPEVNTVDPQCGAGSDISEERDEHGRRFDALLPPTSLSPPPPSSSECPTSLSTIPGVPSTAGHHVVPERLSSDYVTQQPGTPPPSRAELEGFYSNAEDVGAAEGRCTPVECRPHRLQLSDSGPPPLSSTRDTDILELEGIEKQLEEVQERLAAEPPHMRHRVRPTRERRRRRGGQGKSGAEAATALLQVLHDKQRDTLRELEGYMRDTMKGIVSAAATTAAAASAAATATANAVTMMSASSCQSSRASSACRGETSLPTKETEAALPLSSTDSLPGVEAAGKSHPPKSIASNVTNSPREEVQRLQRALAATEARADRLEQLSVQLKKRLWVAELSERSPTGAAGLRRGSVDGEDADDDAEVGTQGVVRGVRGRCPPKPLTLRDAFFFGSSEGDRVEEENTLDRRTGRGDGTRRGHDVGAEERAILYLVDRALAESESGSGVAQKRRALLAARGHETEYIGPETNIPAAPLRDPCSPAVKRFDDDTYLRQTDRWSGLRSLRKAAADRPNEPLSTPRVSDHLLRQRHSLFQLLRHSQAEREGVARASSHGTSLAHDQPISSLPRGEVHQHQPPLSPPVDHPKSLSPPPPLQRLPPSPLRSVDETGGESKTSEVQPSTDFTSSSSSSQRRTHPYNLSVERPGDACAAKAPLPPRMGSLYYASISDTREDETRPVSLPVGHSPASASALRAEQVLQNAKRLLQSRSQMLGSGARHPSPNLSASSSRFGRLDSALFTGHGRVAVGDVEGTTLRSPVRIEREDGNAFAALPEAVAEARTGEEGHTVLSTSFIPNFQLDGSDNFSQVRERSPGNNPLTSRDSIPEVMYYEYDTSPCAAVDYSTGKRPRIARTSLSPSDDASRPSEGKQAEKSRPVLQQCTPPPPPAPAAEAGETSAVKERGPSVLFDPLVNTVAGRRASQEAVKTTPQPPLQQRSRACRVDSATSPMPHRGGSSDRDRVDDRPDKPAMGRDEEGPDLPPGDDATAAAKWQRSSLSEQGYPGRSSSSHAARTRTVLDFDSSPASPRASVLDEDGPIEDDYGSLSTSSFTRDHRPGPAPASTRRGRSSTSASQASAQQHLLDTLEDEEKTLAMALDELERQRQKLGKKHQQVLQLAKRTRNIETAHPPWRTASASSTDQAKFSSHYRGGSTHTAGLHGPAIRGRSSSASSTMPATAVKVQELLHRFADAESTLAEREGQIQHALRVVRRQKKALTSDDLL